MQYPFIFLVLAMTVICILLYCLFSIALNLPPFKSSRAFKKRDKGKKHTVSGILTVFSKALAKYIPMGMLKQAELEKVLQAANLSVSPKEYMAAAIVSSLLFAVFAIPLCFINPILAFIPLALAVYTFYRKYNEAFKKGDKRKLEIEKELPRFVSYMANTLKSSRNLIDMIDTYKVNYNSPLTEELSITVADMRTGNHEKALQRLEARINSPLMGELVRGLLSALRGDDMTAYFNNLSYKLSTVWRQRLTEQALKKEPKISLMSYLLFGCAIVTMFIILGVLFVSASSKMRV